MTAGPRPGALATIAFTVPGRPIPKGSTRSFNHFRTGSIITRQQNADALYPWEKRVAHEARAALAPLAIPWALNGAYLCDVDFFFSRPKSHYRRSGSLKPGAPRWHTTRPDEDKITRAIRDALTSILWTDDSQVVGGTGHKWYVEAGGSEGVGIEVSALAMEPE